jgi:hypothetical protein
MPLATMWRSEYRPVGSIKPGSKNELATVPIPHEQKKLQIWLDAFPGIGSQVTSLCGSARSLTNRYRDATSNPAWRARLSRDTQLRTEPVRNSYGRTRT